MDPRVSFIVPCYKLAHLLAECVGSILAQSYGDFELIILDDCSPDNTGDVARSFADARIRYVRNENNLGHLANYNKGIALARGAYIWLISADDRLSKPYVLARYMEVMERDDAIGFACCTGMALEGGRETSIVEWAVPSRVDAVVDGRVLLSTLVQHNRILAASVLVRRRCYETLGAFPLDLPYAGDWHLWCLFALHSDVACFAEPMVNYRMHELAMTNTLIDSDLSILSADDIKVRWRIKHQVEDAGYDEIAAQCEAYIVDDYVANLTSRTHNGTRSLEGDGHRFRMTLAMFDQSLAGMARTPQERERVRKRVMAGTARRLRRAARRAALRPGQWPGYLRRVLANPSLLLRSIWPRPAEEKPSSDRRGDAAAALETAGRIDAR